MEDISVEKIENAVKELALNTEMSEENKQEFFFTQHTKEEYEKIKDGFIRYRMMVNDAIALYEQAREYAAISDTGLSASIYRMAEPFRKGHFTLAVVGKMSAGKSTFLNALLGDKDFLPTGYFQTTCTLTTISHSEEKKLHVLFGNDEEIEITENIGKELARLVAIEAKYTSLPVNNINRLVLDDVPFEEICGAKLKEEMEVLSNNTIDVELLKEYLRTHPKEKIPKEVAIECPLSENFRGWLIVDTPGVDAVGGIEDDTRKFLCGKDDSGNHNVDAIIFIQAAKGDMQSKSLNDFVNDTIGSLTEEARKRSFFVLTHATNADFLARKDEIMGLAKQLFVDYAHVGDDSRLIAVDSLASLLEEDSLLDYKSLVKSKTPPPSHWNAEVWKDCRSLLQQVKNILEDDDEIEFNNENIRNKLHDLSNFDTFRKDLNNFVRSEKNSAFNEIVEKIEKEINACISIRQHDVKILETNLGTSPQDFLKDLENEKRKLDQFQKEVNFKFKEFSKKYGKSKIDKTFQEGGLRDITPSVFKGLSSLKMMRGKAEDLGEKAKDIAKTIQQNVINDIDDFMEISQSSQNFVLPPIDSKEIAQRIEVQANRDSDKTVQKEYKEDVTTTGFFIRKKAGNIVKKTFLGTVLKAMGNDPDDWGTEVRSETVHYTDMELAAISFSNSIKKEIGDYCEQIAEELECLLDLIDNDIKTVIKKRKEDYDTMAKNTDLVDQIGKKEREINTLQTALSRLEIYHL